MIPSRPGRGRNAVGWKIPLTPEDLARTFGGEVPDRLGGFGPLQSLLSNAILRIPEVAERFTGWQRVLGGGEVASLPGRPSAGRELERWGRCYGLRTATAADLETALFVVHTYLAWLLKLMIRKLQAPLPGRELSITEATRLARTGAPDRLLEWLSLPENGPEDGIAAAAGRLAGNAPEACFDWFRWSWHPPVAALFGELLAAVDALAAPGQAAGAPPDLFQPLHRQLIPRPIRHRLGEYYTPAWLARHLLDRIAPELYRGPGGPMAAAPGAESLPLRLAPDSGSGRSWIPWRFFDPACGSGVFLLELLNSFVRQAKAAGLSGPEAWARIRQQVAGQDRQPLAVLMSRVNCLAARIQLLPSAGAAGEIPIRRGDILRPDPAGVPVSPAGYDRIVGNPPWINWEHLPPGERRAMKPLWERYGLFPHRGLDAIMGQGKKDLSQLLTYALCDRYLADGGTLGFILTRSVLKSGSAGQGFRRFSLPGPGGGGVPLRVQRVDDFSQLNLFSGGAGQAVLVVLEKGRPTEYPVPYMVWRDKPGDPATQRPNGQAAFPADLERLAMAAEPADLADSSSPWLTAPPEALPALRKVFGPSAYRAHAGVYTGGANGVFWLEAAGPPREGRQWVRNLSTSGLVPVARIEAELESALLFPLLRGPDVRRWRAAPSALILMVQDPERRRGWPEDWLRQNCPLAWHYLKRFEPQLRGRAAFRRYFAGRESTRRPEGAPFYSMFDVGPYSFSPYKVVWPGFGARRMQAAVAGRADGRPVMPNQAMHPFIAVPSEEEAHYLCAVLNAAPVGAALLGHTQVGGKSFAQPGAIARLRLPRFNHDLSAHRALADLSRRAHAAAADSPADIPALERQIDALAAALWDLTPPEHVLLARLLQP